MASKRLSKNMYTVVSPGYDLLDKTYFADKGRNPRDVISELIPDDKCMILDMCCGTFSNGLSIAAKKPEAIVVGLDRSKPMLGKARQKVKESGLDNCKLICRDATDTGIRSETFDFIIIGLVLHECNSDLWNLILSEAHRLLKMDGRLIILDWERPASLGRKIKYAPIYACEALVTPKYFKEYYYSDKTEFFLRYGFAAERREECNYTFVMTFKKTAVQKENRYTERTSMLDYDNYKIQELIRERGWKNIPEYDRINAIYNFVRDEILFGYNVDDSIPASKVLKDGYGQCNTKGTLFMALLRACDIPCRVHGFTIDKKLQKGAMTGFVYNNAPKNIFHSWVEVFFEDRWYELEAFIIDKVYLENLQKKYSECTGAFCEYGVGVKDFRHPVIDFDRNNTYIQSEGINQDFGVYDSPDALLKEYHQELSGLKKLAYRHYGRHMMNRNVRKIRGYR